MTVASKVTATASACPVVAGADRLVARGSARGRPCSRTRHPSRPRACGRPRRDTRSNHRRERKCACCDLLPWIGGESTTQRSRIRSQAGPRLTSPPPTATTRMRLRPRRAAAGSSCPASRSASGTTSATTGRSRRSATIVRRAFDLGVTHFDLANNYGPPDGSAEENFGRILRDDFAALPRRDRSSRRRPATTCGPGPYGDWGSRKYLLELARPEPHAPRPRLRRHLLLAPPRPRDPDRGDDGRARRRRAHGQGALRRHLELRPEQTRAATSALAAEGVPLLIHQPRYNMFDRHPRRACSPRSTRSASARSCSRRSRRVC